MSATVTHQTANPGGFSDNELSRIGRFISTQRNGGYQSGSQSDTNLLFRYLLALNDSYVALQEQVSNDNGGNVVGDGPSREQLQEQIQVLTSKLESASANAIGSIPSQQEILSAIPLQELASATVIRLVGLIESSNIVGELNQQSLARITSTPLDTLEPVVGILGDPSVADSTRDAVLKVAEPASVVVANQRDALEVPAAKATKVSPSVATSKSSGGTLRWLSAPDAWKELGGRDDKVGSIDGEDGSAIAFKTFRQQSDEAFKKRFPTRIAMVDGSKRRNGEPWIAMR